MFGVRRNRLAAASGFAGEQAPASQQGVQGVWQIQQKKSAQRHGFKTGEFIVYPAHGVGQIVSIDEQEVAGHKLELFVIDFQKDKMRLKVPVAKATSIGMRKLSEDRLCRARAAGRAGPRPRQAHHVVAPRPGI